MSEEKPMTDALRPDGRPPMEGLESFLQRNVDDLTPRELRYFRERYYLSTENIDVCDSFYWDIVALYRAHRDADGKVEPSFCYYDGVVEILRRHMKRRVPGECECRGHSPEWCRHKRPDDSSLRKSLVT